MESISHTVVWITFFSVGILVLILFWRTTLSKMKKHVEKIKNKYQEYDFAKLKNAKVYFKNFDLLKSNKFFPENPLTDPIYNFSTCDLYVNEEVILLVGKTKILGKDHKVNITCFKKIDNELDDKTKVLDIKRTGKKLEVEFKDLRFEKNIIALIHIENENQIDDKLSNWI